MLGAHGHFAALGPEHLALDADNVADVILLEAVVVVLIHLVLAGVELDSALDVYKRQELENRIAKMQEWEQLAQDASAEAEAIRDTIKAEMCIRDRIRSLSSCITNLLKS